MTAMGVVPAFDELEDGHARFYLGFEAAAVEQFTFERGEETLAHRVIEAIADRAHRGPHAGLAATLAEGERSVLATLVRMMDHGGGPALPQRQVERLQHQFGAQMGCHRPADDSAAESVEHYRQVKKPGPSRDVSYVGDPQPIGCRGDEVAFDQIGCRPRARLSHRGSYPFAAAHSTKVCGLHQARDPLASEMDANR